MATESVEKLSKVVERALKDDAYAERLFKEPDAVAAEYRLSATEKLVVKQMNREQFVTARKDAAKRAGGGELTDKDLADVAGGRGFSSPALGTAANMILGRSITRASGGPLSHLAGAGCDCCGWKGSINMGALVLPGD
jgi:hypothetical protein